MYLLISRKSYYNSTNSKYLIDYSFIEKLKETNPKIPFISNNKHVIYCKNYVVAPKYGTILSYHELIKFSKGYKGFREIPIDSIKDRYLILEINRDSLDFILDPIFFKFDFKSIKRIFKSRRIPSVVLGKKAPKNFNFRVVPSYEFINKLLAHNLVYDE